jgi:hypothetical protein
MSHQNKKVIFDWRKERARRRGKRVAMSETDEAKKKERRREDNRLSAQKSRKRKADYIEHLEDQVETLETRVAELEDELANCKRKRKLKKKH